MNRAQRLVYWLDKKTKIFEKIEISRADWFEKTFDLAQWFSNCNQILDIGAGVCDITKRICKYSNAKVVGIDIEDFRRKGNRKNIQFDFCITDASNMPFKNSSFDCVTVFWTLHHISNYNSVLKEIDRLLKNGGQLIILEDLVNDDFAFRGCLTRIYDKLVNLEFSSHPHTNQSLKEWDRFISNSYGYNSIELREIPWFTKWNLLKFGLLRYIK